MNRWLIYLLEDNEDDIYLIKQFLANYSGRHQFRLKAFKDLSSLKAATQQCYPDILLIDLNLPESTGLNTLVAVKHFVSNTPIIVLTGNSEGEIGEKTIQLGAQDYIPKYELTTSLLTRTIVFSKERFELQRNLENMVVIDKLTMLNNRGSFDNELHKYVQDAIRYNTRFGLLFIDLDNFKTVNDELGHQAGDQLLKSIAAKLKMFRRTSDFVARYGGDEFVIIAPHVSDKQQLAKLTLHKYNLLADSYCIEGNNSQIHEVNLEVSIGAVLFPEDGENESQLINNADAAMYHAKEAGRPFKINS
ncbi:GGDEF domain-containing response regulator [Pseudoalteromonas sp. JBTF-M23]|uniref:GGDEF domain-containing response regulator n=1 Tax=Pseudoalteromonas caenipelagi TaxID=2726988 RepID=A0A849VHE2_9GAMM|nr:GGDEF domain-containing response regulator [Pseudoalteromonas caenipelagi]NOU53189.1 GGDEF domain-containing response regulator [Pseudoalteromonas caenipelagi]